MSMNLHVRAGYDVVFPNGEKTKRYENFELWQTPTKVTREILAQDNKLEAYIKWANDKRHEKEVREWVKYWEKRGVKIEWFEM